MVEISKRLVFFLWEGTISWSIACYTLYSLLFRQSFWHLFDINWSSCLKVVCPRKQVGSLSEHWQFRHDDSFCNNNTEYSTITVSIVIYSVRYQSARNSTKYYLSSLLIVVRTLPFDNLYGKQIWWQFRHKNTTALC